MSKRNYLDFAFANDFLLDVVEHAYSQKNFVSMSSDVPTIARIQELFGVIFFVAGPVGAFEKRRPHGSFRLFSFNLLPFPASGNGRSQSSVIPIHQSLSILRRHNQIPNEAFDFLVSAEVCETEEQLWRKW